MKGLLLSVVLCAWAAYGCSSAPPPVDLSPSWPASVGDYETVTKKWTRHGTDSTALGNPRTKVMEQTIEVYATFKSPEWLAAYAEEEKRRHRMSPASHAQLVERLMAESEEAYEVELLVATYDRRVNDLQKGERSTWRVALVDDAGNEVVSTDIKRDRRPRSELAADYPHIGDFHEAYVARFPKSIEVLREDARRFDLKVTSGQGAVILTWAE